MKKLSLFVLVLSLAIGCQSRESRQLPDRSVTAPEQASMVPVGLSDTTNACVTGEKAAKADVARGEIGYYFWGIAIPPSAKVLREKYGFTIHARGCAASESDQQAWSCYNAYMDKVIQQKYGRNVVDLENAASR